MEIDIPELEDLKFVEDCGRCYDGQYAGKPCYRCAGLGKFLTNPGERLIKFLKSLGIHIPNPEGWKEIDRV